MVLAGRDNKNLTTRGGFVQNKAFGRREKYPEKKIRTDKEDGENGELG